MIQTYLFSRRADPRPFLKHLFRPQNQTLYKCLLVTYLRCERKNRNIGKRVKSLHIIPRASTSSTHRRTTKGIAHLCAVTTVVKSEPKTPRIFFISGRHLAGTSSEHLLWAIKPQSSHLTP